MAENVAASFHVYLYAIVTVVHLKQKASARSTSNQICRHIWLGALLDKTENVNMVTDQILTWGSLWCLTGNLGGFYNRSQK